MRNFLLVLILLFIGFEVWMLSSVEEAGRLPGDSAMAAGVIGLAGLAAMAFNLVVLLPGYAFLRKRNAQALLPHTVLLAAAILSPLMLL
ncbi:MAG: hypothetical protein KA144_15450 [Xanthomonadaceae bacterium]|nr:hypothetical protein [Xanthomonadaceae bacterium]